MKKFLRIIVPTVTVIIIFSMIFIGGINRRGGDQLVGDQLFEAGWRGFTHDFLRSWPPDSVQLDSLRFAGVKPIQSYRTSSKKSAAQPIADWTVCTSANQYRKSAEEDSVLLSRQGFKNCFVRYNSQRRLYFAYSGLFPDSTSAVKRIDRILEKNKRWKREDLYPVRQK